MLDRLKRSHPFQTPDTKRLAILFAVVYFAQDMWSLPHQTLIITLKERGLSAGQVATFFTFSIIPWLIKPTYEFLSDFVPLFGQRRRSYLLLTSLLAAGAGLAMGLAVPHSYWWLTGLFTIMGLGLAFTDVLVDALMVENGKHGCFPGRAVGRHLHTSRPTRTSSPSVSTDGAHRWRPCRPCWASPRAFMGLRRTTCCTPRSQPDRHNQCNQVSERRTTLHRTYRA